MPRLFTYLICTAVVATLAGGIGGSFQPARVIVGGSALLAVMMSDVSVTERIVARAWTMAIVMILFGALSLFWTVDAAGGIGLILAISIGALSFYVVARAASGPWATRLLTWAWTAAAALSVPIAAYEIATGSHFAFALDDRNVGGNMGLFPFASIFFGNYNDYSTWLCLAFPMALTAFIGARTIRARLFTILVNTSIVGIIFVNTSRTALVYIAFMSILYMAISKRLRMYAGTVLAVLLPIFIIRYQDEIFRIYDFAVYRFGVTGTGDESYLQRSGLLDAGYNAIIDSFGAGVGVGGFDEYITDYYPYLIPNPHNILLEIGVNFGLITLAVFVAFMVQLAIVGIRRKDLPIEYRVTIVSGVASVPIVGAISSQAVGYIYWWIWLATLIAMATTRVNLLPESQPDSHHDDASHVFDGPQ